VVEKLLINRHACRKSANKGYERFAMAFAGC